MTKNCGTQQEWRTSDRCQKERLTAREGMTGRNVDDCYFVISNAQLVVTVTSSAQHHFVQYKWSIVDLHPACVTYVCSLSLMWNVRSNGKLFHILILRTVLLWSIDNLILFYINGVLKLGGLAKFST